jgi:hypothetical protein
MSVIDGKLIDHTWNKIIKNIQISNDPSLDSNFPAVNTKTNGHLEKYPFRAAYKSDSKNLFEFDHRERVRWGNWVSLI